MTSLSRSTADSAPATDVVTRAEVLARTQSDSASTTDVITRGRVSARTASDASSVSDVITRVFRAFRITAESAGASDVVVTSAVRFLPSVSDGIIYGGTATMSGTRPVGVMSGGILYGGWLVPQGQPTSGTLLVRWRFDDPVDASTYLFEINPNAGGSAKANQTVTVVPTTAADGVPLIFAGDSDLLSSQFSGVLHSQAQYDNLKAWFDKRHPIQMTDDLGRRSIVNLTRIGFKRAGLAHTRFRQTYTVDYQILAQLDV